MKQNFYKITASNKFQTVIAFLRKELGWKQSDALVRDTVPYLLVDEEGGGVVKADKSGRGSFSTSTRPLVRHPTTLWPTCSRWVGGETGFFLLGQEQNPNAAVHLAVLFDRWPSHRQLQVRLPAGVSLRIWVLMQS